MKLPRPVSEIIGVAHEVFAGYSNDRGSLIAAAVSYYVFLSFVPVVLLTVAIYAFVMGSPEQATRTVLGYVNDYSPAVTAKSGLGIKTLIEEVVRGRSVATGAALLGFIWAGISAMAALEQAINTAWNVVERRGFFRKKLVEIESLLIVGLLLAVSIFATAAIKAISSLNYRFWGLGASDFSWIWKVAVYMLPVLVTIAAFTMLYERLPNTKVAFRYALAGGLFSGIMWEIAKQAFSMYVTQFADYSKVYGSLGGVILFLVWINYSSIVTILGAKVGSVLSQRNARSQKA